MFQAVFPPEPCPIWILLERGLWVLYLERVMIRICSVALMVCLALLALFGAAPAMASEHDHLVAKHAAANGVPEALVRRVIHIESKGNPRVVSKGNYGLMQIRLGTARAMGYGGDVEGLLDADTNMTYAVKYLAGAYRAARGNHEQAIRNYQRGYYYEAKAQGFSPYTGAPLTQQAAAPDPAMVKEAEDRRKAVALQRAAAEQQRQVALQSRIEERKQIESTRAAQREAAARERADRQKAVDDSRIAQRQAALRQQGGRDQSRERQPVESSAAREPQPAEREQVDEQRKGEQPAQPSTQPLRPDVPAAARPVRRPEPTTAWYNPMRFFNHPSHKSHPYRPAER